MHLVYPEKCSLKLLLDTYNEPAKHLINIYGSTDKAGDLFEDII